MNLWSSKVRNKLVFCYPNTVCVTGGHFQLSPSRGLSLPSRAQPSTAQLKQFQARISRWRKEPSAGGHMFFPVHSGDRFQSICKEMGKLHAFGHLFKKHFSLQANFWCLTGDWASWIVWDIVTIFYCSNIDSLASELGQFWQLTREWETHTKTYSHEYEHPVSIHWWVSHRNSKKKGSSPPRE